MGDIVEEGDHVVLMKSFDSGNMKIIHVLQDTTIHYGKLHFDPKPLIGAQYGEVFRIEGGTMFKVDNFEAYDEVLSEMVSKSSLTFNDKTQYSQEKIINKKKKKNHANVVTLMRPSLLLINEMLFARDKLGGLRVDLLAQLITLSNIQNGSKCLVLDHNLGIITTAVMSRIVPDGVCIQLLQDYEVIQTTRKTMDMLNLTNSQRMNNLCSLTIRDMYKVFKKIDRFEEEGQILESRNKSHLDRLAEIQDRLEESQRLKRIKSEELDEESTKLNTTGQLRQTLMKKEINRGLRQRERVRAAKYLHERSLDSIIIVVQYDHPLPILKMMYHFLAPSRQIVIYSDTVNPLIECYRYLRANSLAVSLNISESWLRKYQVLPNRTRPEMNVSGYGGYLLSGTKALFGSSALISENAVHHH